MGRKVKQLKNYSTEQIEALFESNASYRTGVKLYTILQLSRGYSSRALEAFFRVSFKQICNWADRFDTEGIAGLHLKPGRGRRSRLSNEQKHQLKGDLLRTPKDFGYDAANWSASLTGEHIRKMYQVEYGRAAIYNLMRKMGLSF